MVLTDGVVTLRPPADADAPEMARTVQASLETLAVWMPWATADYSEASAAGWITHSRSIGQAPFVLLDPSGAIVGACSLQQGDIANRTIQLGYWLGAPHTGRGYMTRAARLVVVHALDDLRYHRVEILISTQNRPSQRVAERLDAHLEATLRERLDVRGTWHDAYLYAIIA